MAQLIRAWGFFLRLIRLFGARGLEVGVRYGLTLALAIVLGVDGAGQIYLGLALIVLMAGFARCGLNEGLVRPFSLARQAHDAEAARGLAAFGLTFVATLGSLLSLLLLLTAPWLATRVFSSAISPETLMAFACGTLGTALLALLGNLMIAMGRPVLGQTIAALLWPLPVLVWLLLPGATLSGWEVTGTAWIITLAMLASSALGTVLLVRLLGGMRPLRWPAMLPTLVVALPLFGSELSLIMIYHLPIIALGMVGEGADLGLFGLASRLSMLLTVMGMAVYAITAPRFAALDHAADNKGLERAAHAATRLAVVASLPVILLFWVLPGPLLGLFGPDFRAAAPLLIILSVGHCIHLALSPAHTLLAMSGHARDIGRNSSVGVLVLLISLPPLMLQLGALGAAIAGTVAYATISLANACSVRRRLGIALWHSFSGPAVRGG